MCAATDQQRPATVSRALADIQYNSILADHATSSEDESLGPDAEPDFDDRAAIGVSIGREQTRLLSPRTPAVEKAAALQSGSYFDGAFDHESPPITESPSGEEEEEDVQEVEADSEQVDGRRIDSPVPEAKPPLTRPPICSPSPGTRDSEKDRGSFTRSLLRDGFSFNRRRASSGPESRSKSLFSSFPLKPKKFSIGSSSSAAGDGVQGCDKLSRKSSLSSKHSSNLHYRARAKTSEGLEETVHNEAPGAASQRSVVVPHQEAKPADLGKEGQAKTEGLPSNLQLTHISSKPVPLLRRSTSDNALPLQRALSTVSSLGDDSRFEHVSEQVNSRIKAVKDSLQDSRLNMPSMPSISTFNVSSFTPDFLSRERSNSSLAKYGSRIGSFRNTKSAEKPVDPMTRQFYTSARAAATDSGLPKSLAHHPHFHSALERLQGDVVILGGYRGSVLRSAEPPHRQLWVPMKVGLNLRKVDLEVGLEEDADERATEKIIPGGMLTHIGPVDIARRLFKRLRASDNARDGLLRVHEYSYDWRLHPTYLSKQLTKFLEGLACNQPGAPRELKGATVLAHSLGGLIVRHVVNQRPDLFRGVLYAGVPQTCVNILGPLRNGDEVLLSSRVLTAQVNFTIRTSFALLPLDGRCFVDKHTKEEYPVDFFDPQTWIEHRLSPCVGRPLPPLSGAAKPSGLAGYMSSVANAIPTFSNSGRKGSKSSTDAPKTTNIAGVAAPDSMNNGGKSSEIATENGNINNGQHDDNHFEDGSDMPSRTAVTIPREAAIAYLTRTLATVKKFKQELTYNPAHDSANAYPPIAVIYGKSTPTVVGAKVDGIGAIKHADCYDELAFASGDGVVLAKASMAPEGYRTARGGVVSSDRGHITLLGDLEAVGKCLNAIIDAREKGVGLG